MAVLLDLDGTLVDSVFHHVMTWSQALRAHGHDVPLWRLHDGIGMGPAPAAVAAGRPRP